MIKIKTINDYVIIADVKDEFLFQDQLIEFSNNDIGVVFYADNSTTKIVLIKKSNTNPISLQTLVTSKQQFMSINIRNNTLGDVIDIFGNTLIEKENNYPDNFKIDTNIVIFQDRKEIKKPLFTGTAIIDLFFPIGFGQRQLILGDKNTGKTILGVNAAINALKLNTNAIFVYAAIGKTEQEIKSVINKTKEEKIFERCIFVVASINDTPAAQYYGVYSAMTLAEYYQQYIKSDVIVVFDDLTKHADAYRSISLMIGRAPGREAFPGDIFFAHSRLLERAGAFTNGGTITALPIIETIEEDYSSFVVTNVISITDGQIMTSLEKSIKNIFPAINLNVSVSRLGSSVQEKVLTKQIKNFKLIFSLYENYDEKLVFEDLAINSLKNEDEILLNKKRGYILSHYLQQYFTEYFSVEHLWLFLVACQNGSFDFFTKNSSVNKLRKAIQILVEHDGRIKNILKVVLNAKSEMEISFLKDSALIILNPIILKLIQQEFSSNEAIIENARKQFSGYLFNNDSTVDKEVSDLLSKSKDGIINKNVIENAKQKIIFEEILKRKKQEEDEKYSK